MFMPSKDILNQSQRQACNQICCAMGGRVAEELIFGEISTGASGDIKAATQLARRMVCDWGMSDLGPIAFGENADHIFLGREITRSQNYSERTAQYIDDAIVNLVKKEYQRAQKILKEKRSILEAVADALLTHETLEGEVIYEAIKRGDGSPIQVQSAVAAGGSSDGGVAGGATDDQTPSDGKKRKGRTK
ncbi:MAG: cell division protein FtsH, partial [Puniceicoccales bacterium]|jgi:cell division protease FtsH|nr:cell division protein FtsH [Puniceicoccales bacterium]